MDDHAEELTLEVYVVEWLERRRSQLRPTTLKSYRQAIDCYIRPHLGGLRLDEIDRRCLERFYATALLEAGVPVTVVSRRLGHSSATMTLDVYGHVLPAADAHAAERLETLLADASPSDSPA